jgi:hypothetical protein
MNILQEKKSPFEDIVLWSLFIILLCCWNYRYGRFLILQYYTTLEYRKAIPILSYVETQSSTAEEK